MKKVYACPHCHQISSFSSVCDKCQSTAPCVPIRVDAPMTICFPLSNHAECEIRLSGHITRADFKRLKSLLDVAEAGLVNYELNDGDPICSNCENNLTTPGEIAIGECEECSG